MKTATACTVRPLMCNAIVTHSQWLIPSVHYYIIMFYYVFSVRSVQQSVVFRSWWIM